jgi:hypothetical protein
MNANDLVSSKNFGDWSRWLLAYVISLTIAVGGVIWALSGYSHDLSNELAGIHNDSKTANHKLDIVLGIPGESSGLLPPLVAKADEIGEEQRRLKLHQIEEDAQRIELAKKLDTLIQTTGVNNPILNRIDKKLSPPHGGGE